MKNLKTSTKISLKFTILTSLFILFFGFVSNIIYFSNWYKNSVRFLDIATNLDNNRGDMPFFRRSPMPMRFKLENIEIKSELGIGMVKSELFLDITKIEDEYFLYKIKGDKLLAINVTNQVYLQINLMIIFILVAIIFGFLSYLVSLYFVKSSLKSLNKLVDFAKELNLDNLEKKIDIIGPEDDEIKILADKLNIALDKILNQTNSLKDFISNSSHELKTPLMVINSELDYMIKSKSFEGGMENIKTEIKKINNLIETLTLITKIDSGVKFDKQKENISTKTREIIDILSEKYKYKNISLNLDIKENISIYTNLLNYEIIIKNLIENAYKYTADNGNIQISLDDKRFSIKDDGIGIDKENIAKVFDRFFKENKIEAESDENSFGLGLYIVKKLVQINDWIITVDSQEGIGTAFIIYFDQNESLVDRR